MSTFNLDDNERLLVNEFRRVHIMDWLGHYIEAKVSEQFWPARDYGTTINRSLILEEPGQRSTQVTAGLAAIVRSFWTYEANLIFQRCGVPFRVEFFENKDEHGIIKSYDLAFKNLESGALILVEDKLGQGADAWRGSKSSTKKVRLFLLIKLQLDVDMEIHEGINRGVLGEGLFAALVPLQKSDWQHSSKGSHGTTFRFENSTRWDLEELRRNCILKGDLCPKRAPGKSNCRNWYAIQKERLSSQGKALNSPHRPPADARAVAKAFRSGGSDF